MKNGISQLCKVFLCCLVAKAFSRQSIESHRTRQPWVNFLLVFCEDIALLAELGFNLYRFFIEWARIEPEPGEFSRAAFEHYRRMLATCHEHGITLIQQRTVKPSARWLGSIARANGF